MLNRLTEVFASFQKHEVKYLVIGCIAAVLYGVPRATFDLDILIEASTENAKNLLNALLEARFGTADLTSAEEILSNEITVFKDRVRIDVQIRTPGLEFAEAWKQQEIMNYQGQDFFVVSENDLIRAKRASGREVDLEDARLLELPDKQNNV